MDNKNVAMILGIGLGVVAVTAAIGAYSCKHRHPKVREVGEIVDDAKHTVEKLNEAVEMLRKCKV